MDQIFRHLSPGGWFYAQDPNVHAVLRKVGRVLMGKRYDRYHSPDERELDPAELRKAVRAHGFRDVKTGCIDFTLIPSSYLWPRGPRWFFRLCTLVDRTLCRSPLSRWPSGFYLFARK
jgi:hypothetical protein